MQLAANQSAQPHHGICQSAFSSACSSSSTPSSEATHSQLLSFVPHKQETRSGPASRRRGRHAASSRRMPSSRPAASSRGLDLDLAGMAQHRGPAGYATDSVAKGGTHVAARIHTLSLHNHNHANIGRAARLARRVNTATRVHHHQRYHRYRIEPSGPTLFHFLLHTVLAAAEQRLDILFEERRTEKLRAAGLLEAAPNRPGPGPETKR
jgi:hypothetical protein